jgi:5-methylthioadenosine/S-adenosylhomocysteine deaminase
MREPADLVIEPRWLLPMTGAGAALEGQAVVINGGRILASGPAGELLARYAPREHVRRGAHALLPGFIDAHTRASLALLRACAPYGAAAAASEALLSRGAGADFVRDGTRLAMASMLRAGITCFADLSLYPEETARAAAAAQMRVCVALPGADEGEGATVQLSRAEWLWDEYRSDPRVSLYFAPLDAAALSEATLARVRRVADELEARVALDLGDPRAPALGEVRDAGAAPPAALLARLARLGLLRPGFTAIGEPDAAGVELIERHGAALIACPQAGLRRAATALPLLGADRTGLGSGSPVDSGVPDLLAEARTAALLSGCSAARALRLATLGSATALGLAAQVGSIEAGKAADLTCIELDSLTRSGSASVEDAILFASTRQAVSDVWTGGRAAVKAHALLAFDAAELERIPARWTQRLLGAAA